MKLKMMIDLNMEQASNVYEKEEVSIRPAGENSVLIEAECSLQKAIQLIGMDQSEGDRSIDLRR